MIAVDPDRPMICFIPALRFSILTPIYDVFMRLAMKDLRLKTLFVSLLNLKAGISVLDFGCGTGTLTILIKRGHRGVVVTGVDIDEQILEIARKKALKSNIDVDFNWYDGEMLPYPDRVFEVVVSSYVVHHLSREDKARLFREIFRVLKPRGFLYIMDFGVPHSWYAKVIATVLGHIEPIEDNVQGRVPEYLIDAGFMDVEELYAEETLFGTVSMWRAEKDQSG